MTALRFVVPMPPNLANARMHWRVKDRERKAYFATLDQYQGAGLLPKPPASPFAKARVTSDMVTWNRMDVDNAMARHKWLLDWLESRGYIVNDRHLEWDAFPSQLVNRKMQASIILHVTPL